MSLTTMYPAQNNSPRTSLAAAIDADDTSLTVANGSVLPAAPNLLVLGTGDEAEIVSYTAKNGNNITGLVRGVNGTTPGVWPINTIVARNFTAQDAEAFRENILDLDDRLADKVDYGHGTYYVVGTQTAKTGAWTGNLPDVDALYDGLAIDYWLPFDGSGNATLNLTLKGGTTTGAINCYLSSTTRLTTQIAANNICHLVYQTVTISGTSYTGWWLIKDYYLNDSAYKLYRAGGNLIADSAIYRYQMLFSIDETTVTPLNNVNNQTGTNKTMLTDVEFDPFGEIFYWDSTSNIAAGATVSTTARWSTVADLRQTFNCGSTLTAQEPLYLKVVLQSNGKVKLPSDATTVLPITHTLPSTADGFLYIYLGRTTSNYQLALYPWHPIYYHNGEGLQTFMRAHVHDDRYYTESEIDTKFGKEILYFTSQTVSAASNAQIMRIPASGTNSNITTDTVVLECSFADPSKVTSNVSWQSYAGYITFTGTCTAATTANVTLGTKGN